MLARGADAISPTAHYTAAVWARHGLSHPALATPEGRLLHGALQPGLTVARLAGGPALDGFLLARHRIIDHLLDEAIERGRVSQVVEIAAGLSPRGWRFGRRHGGRLVYVEADLPGMAARKRRALAGAQAVGDHHRVADVDAFAESGPGSLDELVATLDPDRGLAIVTEGLLNYFDRAAVEGLWRRIAAALGRFPGGLYISDLHLGGDVSGLLARAFTCGLSAFVRGRVHLHYEDEREALGALRAAGLTHAHLHRPAHFAGTLEGCDDPAARFVRVVEARP